MQLPRMRPSGRPMGVIGFLDVSPVPTRLNVNLSSSVRVIMIARLWQTRIDRARGREYDTFAQKYSRPMFASLPGCLGALFLGTGELRSVMSLWIDQPSIDALPKSSRYAQTVAGFQATGILREPQTVECFEVTGGTLNISAFRRSMGQERRSK